MLTQKYAQDVVRMIQNNGVKESESVTLAEMLATIDAFKAEMKSFEDKVKAELVERKEGEVFYFPETARKVQLKEGNASTQVDIKGVWSEVTTKGSSDDIQEFWKIAKLEHSKAHEDFFISFIRNHATVTPSDKLSVGVAKMTKVELKEHTS